MENFIVSARKYRPQTFQSVVGQLSLTTTLKNAIKSNHLAHAYLFCGPRGVGKTTCARIFAKTINCQDLTSDFEACNQCESCISFNEQRSYNIHELDAASNNGTDDIKYLIEQVRIPPQIGKYSVYIIDEVHMLSNAAFNAFLKTLEEPPAHAIFILATTEKHKIIPTILSRCQIYDFNRITVANTVSHLQFIAQNENVTVDLNGLNVIAQKSDGGMRDALSIFDQLVSFCGNNITYQGVIDNLNVLDYEYYFKLIEVSLVGDVSKSLLIFNDVLNKGFDAHHFITGLSSHLRDVLVSKDPQTIQLLEVGADIGKRYAQQAQICTVEFIFQALKICNDCDLDYRLSKNKRLLIELALIRICQLTDVKKKELLNDEQVIPIQEIQIEKEIPSTVQQTGQTHTYEAAKPLATQPKSGQSITETKPKVNPQRPVSISINKALHTSAPTVNYESTPNKEMIDNQMFDDETFYKAWREFGANIADEIKKINFNNVNLPKRIAENEFEILVNNMMQENELKLILGDLTQYLINYLQNSAVIIKIKVIEETDMKKSTSPEEKYKKMVQENVYLETLRKNLSMEID